MLINYSVLLCSFSFLQFVIFVHINLKAEMGAYGINFILKQKFKFFPLWNVVVCFIM